MATKVSELKKRATMINDKVRMYLLPPLINAAVRAGASIMNVYKNLDDYDISLKDDKTPITLADRLAHKTIREYLGPTRIPILSEEGREMLYDERRNWELYWLGRPARRDGRIYQGEQNLRSTRRWRTMSHGGGDLRALFREAVYRGAGCRLVCQGACGARFRGGIYLRGDRHRVDAAAARKPGRASASPPACGRVALAPDARDRRAYRPPARGAPRPGDRRTGRSYKFCLLAEGRVDYYVRTTHTYEWDTAAGELILAEAGGRTRTLPDDGVLRYNEKDLRNPWFVCRSKYCKI